MGLLLRLVLQLVKIAVVIRTVNGVESAVTQEQQGNKTSIPVTDDAMVVEYFLNQKVHLVYGSYENIKITTPEDMRIAEVFVKN